MGLPPVDHARLLALLRRLALIAAPVASFDLAGCGPCADPVDQIFLLRNPDAETQALIDACRAPATHNCGPLCAKVSGISFSHCELHADRDGYVQVHVGREGNCPGGRRPQHLVLSSENDATSAAGAFFASQCQLEAASVPAFRMLRHELDAWGAPSSLSVWATDAARDEVRHARSMAALSRRYAGTPRAPRVGLSTPRALVGCAIENVVEGCVREAYGASLAVVQARRSRDPLVRRFMRGIAVDEARHAALAFAVDGWLRTRLSSTERRAMDAARATAIDELEHHASAGWTPVLDATAGLPPPALAGALLGELRRTLWT